MDQAPQLPPRPEKTSARKESYFDRELRRFTHARNQNQQNILDYVPPPPPSSLSFESSCESSHRTVGRTLSSNLPSTGTASSAAATLNPSSSSSSAATVTTAQLPPVPISPSRVPANIKNSFQENILYSLQNSSSPTTPPTTTTATAAAAMSPELPVRADRNNINRTGSRITDDRHLIDWNNLNNNNNNNETNFGAADNTLLSPDNEIQRKDQVIRLIKSMISGNPSQPSTPLIQSPISGIPTFAAATAAHPGMFLGQTAVSAGLLPRGINFVQNPLYYTKLYTTTNQAAAGFGPIYSNLLNNNNIHNQNNNHNNNNNSIHSSSSSNNNIFNNYNNNNNNNSPQAFANLTPAPYGYFPLSATTNQLQDPNTQYINELILLSKINNNNNGQNVRPSAPSASALDESAHEKQSVLKPTSIFDIRQFQSSKSVIDLFDPLANLEIDSPKTAGKASAASPDSKSTITKKLQENGDDFTNNNNNNDDSSEISTTAAKRTQQAYRTARDEPINLLQVDERHTKFSNDLQEFFEHLRALYLSICTKDSPLINSGLVWSARIDMSGAAIGSASSGATDGAAQNGVGADTYICSPSVMKQESMAIANGGDAAAGGGAGGSIVVIDRSISDKTAIFDIRFNSLVFAKLSGIVAPTNDQLKADPVWHSMKLSSTLDNTVDMIITHVSCNVERRGDDDDLEIKFDDFLLKIYSRNEYLQPNSTLSSYIYVQQCKKMNHDIVLELVDQTQPEFWRPFLRTTRDSSSVVDSTFSLEQLLPNRDAMASFVPINARQLNRLLEELNLAIAQFLSMTDVQLIVQERSLFADICTRVEALCGCLSHVKTTRLREAITCVTKFFDKHITHYGTAYAGEVLTLDEILRQFQRSFNELLQALAVVIHCYSATFPVDFQLSARDRPAPPKRTDDITKHIERFKLKLDVVTQVPARWQSAYGFYAVRVTVTHGFKVLDYKYTDKRTLDAERRLEFDKEMAFESAILSELPRETRVDFHLIGWQNATLNASKLDVDILASSFFYLFERENADEKQIFANGTHLVPFTIAKTPAGFTINSYETLDSHCPTICDANFLITHNLDPTAPMLTFEIVTNHPRVQYFYPKIGAPQSSRTAGNGSAGFHHSSSMTDIKFDRSNLRLDTVVPLPPESTASRADSCDSANYNDSLYGFYGRNTEKLDCRNRSQIIKIVQRNPLDPLNRDEKGLIWDNCENLCDFPGAILKILKSPPHWSYADVRKVCALLDSFDNFRIADASASSGNEGAISSASFARSSSSFSSWNVGRVKLPFCTAIEALQLLGSDYPDRIVRAKAVRWLSTVSTDELCDYLPQLVQSLRYEPHLDCPLIWLLLQCALTSSRFCHYLYWLWRSCHADPVFGHRSQIYLNTLRALAGARAQRMFERQEALCAKLETICGEIKQTKENMRQAVLKQRLESLHEFLETSPISIPLSPSVQVCGLEINQCSYFNSNSLPLKIVFQAAPPYAISSSMITDTLRSLRPSLISSIYESKRQTGKIIFKCGDDLRQDMLVMQIISIINRIWIRASLDLRLITFGVMNSAEKTGMIELVGRARTLRQIQAEHGVTGNFKHHTIANWLKRHNPGEFEYMMAVENFIHSCAGYVVITYLLGICDRHNDNIMVTTSGHLFHIDFGKFLGDAQMMAGIRRDRAPFVFTADMAYVINEGDKPSKNFQFFVDLCCRCFSLVRQNGNFLLSLLAMMIPSGIFGLSAETIKYFHVALMPDQTDSQAQSQFYRLIEKALGSYATQLNFFMHTLAQLRFNNGGSSASTSAAAAGSHADFQNYYYAGNDGSSHHHHHNSAITMIDCARNDSSSSAGATAGGNGDGDTMLDGDGDMSSLEDDSSACKFSFTSRRFTKESDDYVSRLEIVDIWKRPPYSNCDKEYYYKTKIDRRHLPESIVYRSFKEFFELYEKMTRTFTLSRFPRITRSRPSTREIAFQRKAEIQRFLHSLLRDFSHEIAHHDMIYTFFHFIHRDQQFLEWEMSATAPLPSAINFAHQQDHNHQQLQQHQQQLQILQQQQQQAQSQIAQSPRSHRKLKLMISYREAALYVLVMYGRNLETVKNASPDTYVKIYLTPDAAKVTKQKTRVITKNPNPTYMEEISYKGCGIDELRCKTLEVSVWANDISGNSRLGGHLISLRGLEANKKIEEWYHLSL